MAVCTDMEGVGGIDRVAGCFPAWRREYERGRALLEGEVAATLAGLRDAGVEQVVVTDWHFAGTNLRRDRVDAPVRGLWVSGRPVIGPASADGREITGAVDLVLMLGMHAAAGAPAFMAHTFWQGLAVEVDDVAVDEAYLWATALGVAGARVGFVAGEAAIVDECAALLPGVPTIAVKETLDRDRARTRRPVEEIREALRDAARDAVARLIAADAATAEPPERQRTVRVTFHESAWAERAARTGVAARDGERSVAARVAGDARVMPFVAACARALPSVRETSWYSRIVPAPEWSRRPEALRSTIAACVHAVGAPVMRHGVRATQAMAQDRYPPPPGTSRLDRT